MDQNDPGETSGETSGDGSGGVAGLSIGDLADRAGVSPSVLRSWEVRHSFPVPRRLASGHRRYADRDVDLVRQVLRRKDDGVRLDVAISEVLDAAAQGAPSIYAEVRRRHPGLPVVRLRKSTLIALSWAIEDECASLADKPILFGGFQRGEFYGPSQERWTELARISRATIVFAEDWGDRTQGGPIRATLPTDAAMRRQWVIICDALEATALLAAWELPGQSDVPDRERLFEAIWTIDPVPVRDAARVAASIAADLGVLEAGRLLYELADPPPPRTTSPSAATAMFTRVLSYVDRLR